jgi:decaprenyl-phosphate phosphoribosyltransferase
MLPAAPGGGGIVATPTLAGHLRIMRVDHWVKNVFVLPGIIVAFTVQPPGGVDGFLTRVVIGLLATGIVASSNYVINEVLDAPTDREHPLKATRPVPSGQVSIPLAYAQWIGLMVAGVALGTYVGTAFAVTLFVLWVMGCVYNIPPVRSKDKPYLDVLSEAVNNPLRMLLGWFIVAPAVLIPVSLLLSYWMAGAYFMAVKRFAEYRDIGDAARASRYRRSFAYYTEANLLTVIMFYASTSMLFLGAFIIRYRLELILSFPLVALVMSSYLAVAFKAESAAQAPEKLYREPVLMGVVLLTWVVMAGLLFVDLPLLYSILAPTLPLQDVPIP